MYGIYAYIHEFVYPLTKMELFLASKCKTVHMSKCTTTLIPEQLVKTSSSDPNNLSNKAFTHSFIIILYIM